MMYDFVYVDTEMCCPKGKCGCQYFILLTLKKRNFMDTGVLGSISQKVVSLRLIVSVIVSVISKLLIG